MGGLELNLPKFLVARDPRNSPHATIIIHVKPPIIHAKVLNNGDLETVYTDPYAKPDKVGKLLKSMSKWYKEYRVWEIGQAIKRYTHEGDIVSVSGVEFVESDSLDLIKCIHEDLGGYIHSYNDRWRLMLISEDYKKVDWVSVKKRIAKLSDGSEFPDQEELEILASGDLVMVCVKKEYLTIAVTSVTDSRVLGIVQSSPKKTILHGISQGDKVSLKKYHIFNVKKATP